MTAIISILPVIKAPWRRVVWILALVALTACGSEQDRVPPTAVLNDLLGRSAQPVGLVPKVPAVQAPEAAEQERAPVRFFGRTGPQPPTGAAPGSEVEQTVTLNFSAAEVTDVVRAILGELLEEPFTVVSEVEGTITIQSSEPVPASSALAVLEEALRLNGGALVKSDGVYTIVPLAQAAGRAPVRQRGESVTGFRITVLPVHYVSARQIAEIVRPVLAEDRLLTSGPDDRFLLFAGTEQETQTVAALVDTFDQDWLKNTNFSVFPLAHVRPSAVVAELEPILGAPVAAVPGGEEAAVAASVAPIRLVPVDRMDAVIIISSSRDTLLEVERLLKVMDVEGRSDEPRLYVYRPQNGEAESLSAGLSALFEGESGTPRRRDAPLAPGTEEAILEAGATDSAAGAGDAEGMPAPGAFPEPPGGRGGGLRIFADSDQNALLVRATPREYALIREALEQLDIAPRQVLVEATVAEVRLTDELRYGLQWFFRSGDATVSLSNGGMALPQQAFPGFSYLLETTDARIVLNALDSITDVNVVSSPQILVLDNQAARLQVGDQVPVATQTVRSVIDPEAPITNTIQYRDTGVILEVRPRVTSESLVVLEIRQEVSDVAVTRTSGIDSPTIQQRNLQSTVAVRSGQTIALGGLIRDRMERGQDGLPLLSNLPIAGALFGTRANRDERTELLVLLTPRVVETTIEAERITRELRDRMRRMRDFGVFRPLP